MHFQHLWIWEGAILILIVLVDITLSVFTKKADDNDIRQYKGLERYVRSETSGVAQDGDARAVESDAGPAPAFSTGRHV
jgi:hypothetical protein